MNSNGVHFKAYLRADNNCEARRFVIDDPSVVTNYEYMKEKLCMVYPVIRDTNFRITWKDEDGDEITITCDDDLLTAMTEMTSRVKKLYITKLDDGECEVDMTLPFNILCDGCNVQIRGYRYKCITCPDYDLCAKCELLGIHSEHVVIRIPNSDMFLPRCAKKLGNKLAKSMKKMHNYYAQEQHRNTKHATKHNEKHVKQNNEAKPSTSQTNDNNTKTKCPVTEQVPLSNLADIAMPVLEMFTQNTTGQRGEQFFESIRKALNNFIEPENPGDNQNNSNESTQNQTKNKPETSSQTEMEVESGQTENIPNKENSKGEHDWTFITPNLEEIAKREDSKVIEALQKLLDMGFTNEEYLIVLIKRFDGNIEAVVKYLLENIERPKFNYNVFQ